MYLLFRRRVLSFSAGILWAGAVILPHCSAMILFALLQMLTEFLLHR